jgi:hypothetical protein
MITTEKDEEEDSRKANCSSKGIGKKQKKTGLLTRV